MSLARMVERGDREWWMEKLVSFKNILRDTSRSGTTGGGQMSQSSGLIGKRVSEFPTLRVTLFFWQSGEQPIGASGQHNFTS